MDKQQIGKARDLLQEANAFETNNCESLNPLYSDSELWKIIADSENS